MTSPSSPQQSSLRALVLLAWTALLLGCAHSRVPLVPVDAPLDAQGREAAEGLRGTVHALVDAGWNPGRLAAAEARARSYGLGDSVSTEWIDWFSFQHNVVIDLPGASDELVLVMAHVDKTDVNLLKLASLFTNGLLDELVGWSYLSEGALDNASGVAIALELARVLSQAPRTRSYRILLTGAEESGLRGARAHAARLSNDDWQRLSYVINVDSLGARDDETCVYTDVSDVALVRRAQDAALARGAPLRRGEMPFFAAGDHSPFSGTNFFYDFGRGLLFNGPAGLLPQRSWFTGSHGTRVLMLADCHLLDVLDGLAAFVPVMSLGRIHGPRDRADTLDPVRMAQAFLVLQDVLGEGALAAAGALPVRVPLDLAPAAAPPQPASPPPAGADPERTPSGPGPTGVPATPSPATPAPSRRLLGPGR